MTALEAAYKAIRARLASQSELWGAAVFSDVIPATAEFPVVQFFWSGGGEANGLKKQDADLVITVKCVAESMSDSMTGAARISALLNDKGENDDASDHLNGGSAWRILTCTQEEHVHLVDMWAGAQPIYHDGHRFRLVMEAK